MTDESPRRPPIGDVLPSEAGILVRDALRTARHTFSVGRKRLETSPLPGGEMASALLGRVGHHAEGSARRVIDIAFQRGTRTLLASASIRAGLGSRGTLDGEERITFVRSVYRTLREALGIMRAPRALVLEGAIEAALAAALTGGSFETAPEVFPARLVQELIIRRAVGHVLIADDEGDADAIPRLACFALGLAMTAELGEPVAEEEIGGLLAAACAMTLALRDEVAAAGSPEDIAALYRSYGPHV